MAKILIVDDSSLIRAVLKNFVVKEGHETIEACDGEEAIKKYNSEKPDVVFLDILMPKMNGLEAAKKIREINPNSKLVIITSLKEENEEKKAKDIGVNGYITKPFSREEIVTIIKNI